jgi:hypothetical protein
MSTMMRSALAAITLVTAMALPVSPATRPAEAAVSVSVDVFYDDLAPYGEWVWFDRSYVFVPADIDSDWRPYTLGHWVYADDYGWTWVSDEPFGWATYHYGRWGYSEEIGWYWVPGDRWAPAWVSWRRSHDHIVWCPLPPVWRGDDLAVTVAVGDIPDYYWVAVPTVRFLDVDLRVVIIDRDRDRRRILDDADFIGTVRVRNDIVVNNVINVNVIEKETGKRVRKVKVRKEDDPRQAKSDDNEVRVFPGRVNKEKRAKPSKISDLEKVKSMKRGKRQLEEPQDQANQSELQSGQSTSVEQPAAKLRKKVNKSDALKDADQTVRPKRRVQAKTKELTSQSSETPDKRKPRKKLQKRGEKPIAKSVDQDGTPRRAQRKRKQVKPQTGQASSAMLQPQNRPKKRNAEQNKKQKRQASGEQVQPKKKKKARKPKQPQ